LAQDDDLKDGATGAGTSAGRALLERGLECYGAGDLNGALAAWDRALAVEPDLAQVQEYIDYVRDNFDALSAQFAAAGAYDQEDDAAPLPPPPADTLAAGLAEVDAGLEIALDEIESTPRPQERSDEDDEGGGSIEMEAMAADEEDEMALAGPLDLAEALPDHGEIEVKPAFSLPPRPEPPAKAVPRPPVMTIQPRPLLDVEREDVHRAPTVPAPPVRPSDQQPAVRSTMSGTGSTPSRPSPPAGAATRARGPLGSSGQRAVVATPEARAPASRSSGQRAVVATPVRSTLSGSGPRPPVPQVTPATTSRPRAPSAPGPVARPSPPPARSASSPPSARYAPGYDLDELLDTRDTGRRRSRDEQPHGVDLPSLGTGFPDEQPTRERRMGESAKPGRGSDDFDEHEQTSDFDDLSKTTEHSPFRTEAPAKRPAQPPGGSPAVIVDKDLLSELAANSPAPAGSLDEALADDEGPLDLLNAALDRMPAGDPEVTSDFKARRDPARDAREERIRRRVSERLREAQEAAEKGDFVVAVTAVEAAQKDDEEGSIAPVLLHRHRDLLYRIYEGHIGDMTAVPLVAVPLHEIAAQALDHRTGFLLSRIDGMLTFEDILDVAGMPRMEAYQILSNLLRRGVIEVRS
jgi:hypothetical protein